VQIDSAEQFLTDVLRAADEGGTLEQALAGALGALGERTGFELGQVWRPSRNGRVLRCEAGAYYARDPEQLAPFRRVSLPLAFCPGEGLPGMAWARREPVWEADMTAGSVVRAPKAREVGLRAGFAFPVSSADRLLAVFELFTTRPVSLPPEVVRVLGPLGSRLGAVLARKPVPSQAA
jgi:hypothetical protein